MRRIESVTKAYHSTRQKGLKKFENRTTTAKIDTGEGAHVHGWGLYLQANEKANKEMYYDMFAGNNYARKEIKFLNKTYECEQTDDVMFLDDYTSLNIYDIYPTPISESRELFFQFLLNGYDLLSISTTCRELLEDEDSYILQHFNEEDIINCAEVADNTLTGEYEVNNVEPDVLEDGTHDEYVSQYTVEIPDDMYFIDEDRSIPSNVYIRWYKYLKTLIEYKDKIPDNPSDEWYEEHISKFNGWRFYQSMTDVLGSQEKASLWLSENGVDGMTYEGGRDGGCFVIYNCDKLKIVGEY